MGRRRDPAVQARREAMQRMQSRGASYADIAGAFGVSIAHVTQDLRELRRQGRVAIKPNTLPAGGENCGTYNVSPAALARIQSMHDAGHPEGVIAMVLYVNRVAVATALGTA